MHQRISLLCLLQLCSLHFLYGQTDPIEQASNILPPSPTASELGKYGLVPVGYATGTANIDLPLYTYSVRSLSVPISLSYNSNGVKVDQLASWVGMGWSLNAGGVITRIVRDEEDEIYPYPYPDIMNMTDIEAAKYIEMAAEDGFDSERDLYAFNFLSYSGKFVFDQKGNPIVLPLQNIKIQRYFDAYDTYFVITTNDGTILTFNATETTRTLSSTCGKNYDLPAVTSWLLTKIENAVGDVINFEYKANTYTFKAGASQTMMKKVGQTICDGTGAGACPGYSDKTCVTQLTIIGATLTRISSPNQGEVEFVSTKTRLDVDDYKLDQIIIKSPAAKVLKKITLNYTFSNSGNNFTNQLTTQELKHRMFLGSFDERDSTNTNVRSHQFNYNDINSLPPRLTFAQDHWGFFNGAANTTMLPKYLSAEDANGNKLFPDVNGNREPNSQFSSRGLLTRITYPTGGYTDLTFQANTYWGTFDQYPSPTYKYMPVTGTGPWTPVDNAFTFNNPVAQDIYITAISNLDPNYTPGELDSQHNFATLKIEDLTSSAVLYNERMFAGERFERYIKLYYPNHNYKFTITANGDIIDAVLYFDYYATAPQEITTNIETGGLRIAKTVTTDVVQNTTEETNYVYAKISDLTKSSGKIGKTPKYYTQTTTEQSCGPGFPTCSSYNCVFGNLYSSSQMSLYPVGGSNIYYENVVVHKGPDYSNGAEEHQFLIQFDEPGYLVLGQHLTDAPYTNFGWGNGNELSNKTYSLKNGTFILLKETSHNYIVDDRYNNAVGNLVVRKKYDPVCTSEAVVYCDASNTNKEQKQWQCVTNHQHLELLGGAPLLANGQTICIAGGALNQEVVISRHPCFGKSAGETVIVPKALSNLDAIEYKTIAYWFYDSLVTEKLYDENGANPVTTVTQFFYDNPQHTFLTRKITTGSDGIARQTSYWYPQDYGAVGNLNTLRAKNIFNIPVKTIDQVGVNQVGGMVLQYNNYGLPKEVYKFRSSQLAPPAVHNANLILPSSDYQLVGSLQYSTSNNLNAVLSESSPSIAYIYDYSESKPIAKIANADMNEVAYTSFESNGKGNWTFSGAPVIDIPCRTGNRYYRLITGNITRSVSSGSYKLEFWGKGVVTVAATGATLIDSSPPDRNGWVLSRYNIVTSAATTLTIAGGSTAYIDELRLYPSDAQISTVTYKEGVGPSSETDSNNITVYYEYDLFGRLKTVKDNDGNVVKTFKYNYRIPQ